MTIFIFAAILGVQLMLLLIGLLSKRRETFSFSIFSILLLAVISATADFKLHHLLRHYWNIPNTFFYLAVFLLLGFYAWHFRGYISRRYYLALFLAAGLWALAGSFDLLSDAGLIFVEHADYIENLFTMGGSISLLAFYLLLLVRDYYYFYSENINRL